MTGNQILGAAMTVFTLFAIGGARETATAQNSTQAPPPSSSKFSGSEVEGDPNGAIRALGSADDGDKDGKPSVTVPHLGGEGADKTGGMPRGTSR